LPIYCQQSCASSRHIRGAELTSVQIPTRISRLMIELDKRSSALDRTPNRSHNPSVSDEIERSADCIINRALIYAVYAYSVRWLDLSENQHHQHPQSQRKLAHLKEELANSFWLQARKQIYLVLSRPSYRSILALYLFAMIPSSPRNSGDNLEDHCIEAALSHHSYLNSRRAQKPFNARDSITSLLESALLSGTGPYSSQPDSPPDADEMERLSMSSLAYWFGIVSDTTRALTRCRPSILLPPGCDSETKVWTPVRNRTQTFKMQFDPLRQLQAPVREDQLTEILQHALAYKTLVWASITRVQDALVHQMSGISLAEAVDAARKERNAYQEIFGNLLCLGLRDFVLLNSITRMYFSEHGPIPGDIVLY